MKVVLQRVASASVSVDGALVSSIGKGYLLLVGLEEKDDEETVLKMAAKVAGVRVFEDENGKTNLSLIQVGGSILSISQFTLLADASNGNRPSFIKAMRPPLSEELYHRFNQEISKFGYEVKEGIFGADMHVNLINEGPFTLVLDSKELFK